MLVYQRVTTMVLLHFFIPTPGMGALVHQIGVHPDIRIQETVLFAAFLWLGLARWGGRSPQKVMKPYLGVPKMRCLPENLGYWNYWNYGNWKYSEKHASNSNYHNLVFFRKKSNEPGFFWLLEISQFPRSWSFGCFSWQPKKTPWAATQLADGV